MPERRPAVPLWLEASAGWTWRLLVIALGVVLLFMLAAELLVVVLPVAVALLLATLGGPPALWLKGKGVPAALSALIVVLGGLVVVVGIFLFIVPQVAAQVQEVGGDVVEDARSVFERILDATPLDQRQVTNLIDQGIGQVQDNAGAIVGGVLGGAVLAVEFFAGLVLSLVLLFFFLKDHEPILAWFDRHIPEGRREDVQAAAGRAWRTLAGYLRGSAVIALVDATGIGLGLLVIGVPLVLPLAVLTFFGGFFPIIGATVAGFVAVMVALVTVGVVPALLTLGVVIGVQQLESNVLEPLVLRRFIPLHPVVIVTTILAGSVLGGIVGAFLAVPITAVAASIGNELRLRHEAREQGRSPEEIAEEDAEAAEH